MASGRLLLCTVAHTVFLVLVLFSETCDGDQNRQLGSPCGDHIHNISFPFRLKTNPDPCGYKNYTLSCENNRTVLSLHSGKYYVQEINYEEYSIRLVDVGIQSKNVCSLPLQSLTPNNCVYLFPYEVRTDIAGVVFVNCENPVKSPLYVDMPNHCSYGVNSSSKGYRYILAGVRTLMIPDFADSCIGEMMVMTSSPLGEGKRSNFSLLDVYNEMAYGFELSWRFGSCEACRQGASCFSRGSLNVTAACSDFCYPYVYHKPTFLGRLQGFISSLAGILVYYVPMAIGPFIVARFLCMPCVFGFLIRKYRRRHLSMFDGVEGFLQSQNNFMPIRYSYWDIKKMTQGFSYKLGEGGYGSVYKGKLRSGNFVAVKILSKLKADGQEFIDEVGTIGRIHHVNIVQLIGYCAEGSKRALVYDFMPNGSLEEYISFQKEKISLSCGQMYKISLGVARGIEYLHRGCDLQILHFDIKPHNILLDENFTPKVSDFGLAKLYPMDDSIVSLTAARGTMGYMTPELFYKNIGGVSYKADVYSFGMLLMEMAGRRRNWNSTADSSQVYLPWWVYDQSKDGKEAEMGETTEEEREMVKKMMLVALWCTQMKPGDRPSMNKVVEMLEGNIELIQMPPKPFLYREDDDKYPTTFSTSLGDCRDSVTLDISAR